MENLNRRKYFEMVSFVINSMLDLAEEEPSYNFESDLEHYYENTIRKENIISYVELIVIVEILKDYRKK